MWSAVTIGLAVFATLFVVARLVKPPAGSGRRPDNPYPRLRDQALSVEAAQAGIVPVEGEAWGIVMDLWVDDATATVVAFADGTASIYLSNGAGFIGGHHHDSIRSAAQAFVDAATAALVVMRPLTETPLPAQGYVTFYARTSSVTLATEAEERRLQSAPAGPVAALFAAGHGVIAAYREVAPAPHQG